MYMSTGAGNTDQVHVLPDTVLVKETVWLKGNNVSDKRNQLLDCDESVCLASLHIPTTFLICVSTTC
jgi:hypothetical protein